MNPVNTAANDDPVKLIVIHGRALRHATRDCNSVALAEFIGDGTRTGKCADGPRHVACAATEGLAALLDQRVLAATIGEGEYPPVDQ